MATDDRAAPASTATEAIRPSATCLVLRRGGGGGRPTELPPERFDEIDHLRAEAGTLVWLAFRHPGGDELRLLEDEFGVHPLAAEDVRKRGQRPKLDTYSDQHMLVLFEAIATGSESGAFELAELHLFAGPGWLVTVQWGESPAVDSARSQFERLTGEVGVGGLVYWVFDAAADSYFPTLDAMAERTEALEDRVLEGDGDQESLREMLAIKRQLLELRRVLGAMREVANALLRRDAPLVEDRTVPYFRDLYDHLVRILDQVDLYRDLLASLVDARLTTTSNSLNAIMRRLTAITVILMAPTLIAGIYGMNFELMPELRWPLGYPFALGLMAATMIGAYVFFRRRDWF